MILDIYSRCVVRWDARAHCQRFFAWYNFEHRHSGVGFMMPKVVHFGKVNAMLKKRQVALDAAFAAHPNRFKNKPPETRTVPRKVWMNPPEAELAPTEQTSPPRSLNP